jgi:hypothetical protein
MIAAGAGLVEGQLPLECLHRDPLLRCKDDEGSDREANWKHVIFKYGRVVLVTLTPHLQQPDPAFHAREVTEKDVAGLDVGGPLPTAFTEPRNR